MHSPTIPPYWRRARLLALVGIMLSAGCLGGPPGGGLGSSKDGGDSGGATSDAISNVESDANSDAEQATNGQTKDASADCDDECVTEGAGDCRSSGEFYRCLGGPSGCLEWQLEATCTDGQVCDEDSGCSCENPCTLGTTECIDGDHHECREVDGCLVFEMIDDCRDPQTCDDATGCSCSIQCTPQMTSCEAGTRGPLSICVEGNVCPEWQIVDACDGAQEVCDDTSCRCRSYCPNPGATRCSDDEFWIEECVVDADGCRYWDRLTRCTDSQYCPRGDTPGACVDCQHTCSAGQQLCIADQVVNCIQQVGDVCPSLSSALGCGANGNCCDSSIRCDANDAACQACGSKFYCSN